MNPMPAEALCQEDAADTRRRAAQRAPRGLTTTAPSPPMEETPG